MSAAKGELRAQLARFTGATAGRGEADVRSQCAGDVLLVAEVARVEGYLPAGTQRIRASAGSAAYEPGSSFALGILH
ncbi:MAG: hypothetical protein ABWY12_08655, partial [Burkholderiales bacterium]